MTCHIDHTAADTIPKILCRACHPELTQRVKTLTQPEADQKAEEQAELFEKRQRRKLRKEAKRLQAEIDKIGGRNPPATAKIQTALDEVNRELYIIS